MRKLFLLIILLTLIVAGCDDMQMTDVITDLANRHTPLHTRTVARHHARHTRRPQIQSAGVYWTRSQSVLRFITHA